MSSNRASRPSQPPPPFVVAIGAHVSSAEHAQLLLRAAKSVRLFHPEAKLVVVDNGSPRYFVAPEGAEVVRHSHSRWAFGAINASLSIALASAARCYTYLQHSMELLRPLPLAGLSCNVVAFRTFEADNWGTTPETSFHGTVSTIKPAPVLFPKLFLNLDRVQHPEPPSRERFQP